MPNCFVVVENAENDEDLAPHPHIYVEGLEGEYRISEWPAMIES